MHLRSAKARLEVLMRSSSFRSLLFGFLGAGLFAIVSYAGPATAQIVRSGFLRLQGSTPGDQETGHANVSGTMIAGGFKGSGTGLVGVNADLLDGFNSTSFLQTVPV